MRTITIKKCFSGLAALSLLLLSACSHTVTQSSSWQKRQAFLAKRNAWQLKSKVSLRLDDENNIFGLNWLQRPQNNYVMQITNPITGALVSKLTRANGTVSLLADNGRTYRDNDEERLLKSQSGLTIPLKGMQYWARGLTAPFYKVDSLQLDNAGRPLRMEQAGWKINYASYENNGTNALPRKINLSRGAEKIFIRLVAKSWQ